MEIFREIYSRLIVFYEKFTEISHIIDPQWQKQGQNNILADLKFHYGLLFKKIKFFALFDKNR